MGCGSCGTKTADGKPAGCQSNGGCSSGGCNRLNVFNWLADIPLSDFGKPYNIVEISFNNGSRKDYYKNTGTHIYQKGEMVTVEGVSGFDVGQISLTGELVKLQLKKYNVTEQAVDKRILRLATENDLEAYHNSKIREKEVLVRSRAMAKQLKLEMKIAEAEFQADGKKITFFYTADARVDFRELIKVYASEFKAKVEMRQIGARQESAKVGGIGSCGRELCCSSWLTEFKTVNTTAARYQNLSINQTKLSGQCGRLKCCLNYELDTYMDALKTFPQHAENLELQQGRAFLQKKDIFKNLMWYSFAGSNKQYPLTIERVVEIMELNAKGEKPDELEAVEIVVKNKNPEKVVEMSFVNDVGQIKLSSLKGDNKKRKKPSASNKGKQGGERGKAPAQNNAQGSKTPNAQNRNRPQQPKAEGQPNASSGGNANRSQQNRPKQQNANAGPRPEQQNRNRDGGGNRGRNNRQNKPKEGNAPNNTTAE